MAKTIALWYGYAKPHNLPTFYLDGKAIEWVDQFKYLGVILDHRLSFVKHAKYIENKVRPRINLLKSMAGPNWGTNTDTLRKYYTSHIRSILEYGNVAMLTACQTADKKIETIQNNCLRIVLGVSQDTPQEILCVETGCFPLYIRREAQAAKYFLKLCAKEWDHPIKEIIKYEIGNNLPYVFPYATWGQRMGQILRKYGFKPPNKPTLARLIPWQGRKVPGTIMINELEKAKRTFKPEELALLADRINEELGELVTDNSINYYTDGSVGEDGITTYGVLAIAYDNVGGISTCSIKGKLAHKTGSMIAELSGIRQALIHAFSLSTHSHYICIHCDSRRALQTIGPINHTDNHDLIGEIHASTSQSSK